MAIDIFEYINHLLHRSQVVIVPGLGAFTSTPIPSVIEHARGILNPPSKVISFNENLKVNDGMLLNYIKNKHGISADDSRTIIENFVHSVKGLLASGESVIFENLGKIYTNTQGKIVFENANRINFNPASFGLPPVKYYALDTNARAKNQAPLEENTIKTSETPLKTVEKAVEKPIVAPVENIVLPTPSIENSAKTSWIPSRKSSLLAAGLVAGTLLTAWYFYNSNTKSEIDAQAINVSENRTNVKPTKELETVADETPITSPDEVIKPEEKVEKTEKIIEKVEKKTPKKEKPVIVEENIEEKSATTSAQSQVVFIGSFSSEKNATKVVKRLKRNGFSIYREKFNGLKRVGTKIKFGSETEKIKAISKIKNIFGSQCWEK